MSLFPKVGRKQPGMRISWWLLITVLCIGVILHLLPFYYMITTSFKSGTEVLQSPPTIWPQDPTLAAWQLIFQLSGVGSSVVGNIKLMEQPFYVYLFNSLFITLVTLLISLPVTAFAAYANSKLQRGPIARWTFLIFIGTLMVPLAVTLLPRLLLTLYFPFALPGGSIPMIPGTYESFPTIKIWDTPWAVILPSVFNAFNFLLFKGFFDTIPNSVIQAARVDGGSEFNIFRRIVLPMSIPVFAVAAWTQFGVVWDDFLWPSLVISSSDRVPMSVAVYTLMNRFTQVGSTGGASQSIAQSEMMREILDAGLSWNGLMVLGILQTIPVFIMFIICREYLLRGVRIRGLK